MKNHQIDEMLKVMMLQEAEYVTYYRKNRSKILDGSLFKYKVVKEKGNEYIVSIIENGDIFVFDDCNYIKFEMPNLQPISFQKNTVVYNNFMSNKFAGYWAFEQKYNTESENIVNIVNFCEQLLDKYKKKLQKVPQKNALKTRMAEVEY